MSPWINHVKEFSHKHGISYREAMQHPEAKRSYHEHRPVKTVKHRKHKEHEEDGEGIGKDFLNYTKKHTGAVIEGSKKIIGKKNMHSLILNGLTAGGVSPDTASVLASGATAGIYSTDFNKSLGGQTGNIVSGTVQGGLNQYSTNQSNATSGAVIGGALMKHGVGYEIGTKFNKKNLKEYKKKVGGSFVGSGGFKGENDARGGAPKWVYGLGLEAGRPQPQTAFQLAHGGLKQHAYNQMVLNYKGGSLAQEQAQYEIDYMLKHQYEPGNRGPPPNMCGGSFKGSGAKHKHSNNDECDIGFGFKKHNHLQFKYK